MKIEPTPSDREVLTGLVERVTYQNAENGFGLFAFRTWHARRPRIAFVTSRSHRPRLTGVAFIAPGSLRTLRPLGSATASKRHSETEQNRQGCDGSRYTVLADLRPIDGEAAARSAPAVDGPAAACPVPRRGPRLGPVARSSPAAIRGTRP